MNSDWQHFPLTAMLALQSCSVTVAIATGVSTAADLSALGPVTMVMFRGGRRDLFTADYSSSAVQRKGSSSNVWSTRTEPGCRFWLQHHPGPVWIQPVESNRWDLFYLVLCCNKTQNSRGSYCSSTSDLRNVKANCVITSTWAEAGRPLLDTVWNHNCCTKTCRGQKKRKKTAAVRAK